MKVAVVGAGPAGLAAGWELKHRGIEVDVFESHSKPGGCASYFRRSVGDSKMLFDAGATVIWAMESSGFLAQTLKRWGLNSPAYSPHKFHRFSLHHRDFVLDSSSPARWTDTLVDAFPNDAEFIRKHFPAFFRISAELYEVLYKVPLEPFLNLKNLQSNQILIPNLLTLAKNFNYLGKFSKIIENCSPEFREWVDVFLVISLQAKSEDVESFYAIAALCFFPLGAGSLEGGMASLFELLTKNFDSETTRLRFKHPIQKIIAEHGYVLKGAEEFGPYSHVLLSCPRWNSEAMFTEKLFAENEKLEWDGIKDKLWSAVVAYLVIEDDPDLPGDAFNHQVLTQGKDYYFSVSKRGDRLRGDTKFRVITASTHEKLDQWNYSEYRRKTEFAGKDKYLDQKMKWEALFTNAARSVFRSKIRLIEIASPKTFQHYTRRKEGFVGGIPLRSEYSLLNSPSQSTLAQNVYQIGDTAFPGQSVVNCMVGALAAIKKIFS